MHAEYSAQVNQLIIKALQASNDGFGVFNQDDILVFCNDTLASGFGYPDDEAIGHSFEEILRHSYHTKSGVKADDDDLEGMVERAKTSMLTQGFSSFDSESIEGEWVHVSRLRTNDGFTYLYSPILLN